MGGYLEFSRLNRRRFRRGNLFVSALLTLFTLVRVASVSILNFAGPSKWNKSEDLRLLERSVRFWPPLTPGSVYGWTLQFVIGAWP